MITNIKMSEEALYLAKECGLLDDLEYGFPGASSWGGEDGIDVLLERFYQAASLAAAEKVKEEAARVCEDKAISMERKAQAADCDNDDSTSLQSSAWLISVCAGSIRSINLTKLLES